jgi:hypothetical protein
MGRVGMAGIAEELALQREAVRGRSAPYERALALLPEVLQGPAARRIEAAFGQRRFVAWWHRPLLLLAALRDDALATGPEHPLHAAFAAEDPAPEAVTEAALAAALDGGRARVFDALTRRRVQTNETSRAVAWLWPAALAGASGGARPLAIADVGASAGLNLVADQLSPLWTSSDGSPLEVARDVHAVARVGFDLDPLDALDPDDARWLRACVWPGDRAREERLEAALAAFRASRVRPDAPVLVPIGAAMVPARLDVLSAADAGALVLAFQTVMRDYLEPAERAEYEEGMRAWLATHPPGQALWIELEPSGDGVDLGGAIVAHVRAPFGALRDLELARCLLHPLRLEVRHDAAAELRALLGAEAGAGARA